MLPKVLRTAVMTANTKNKGGRSPYPMDGLKALKLGRTPQVADPLVFCQKPFLGQIPLMGRTGIEPV